MPGLARLLSHPRTVRFAASASPGWGHVLLRRFEIGLPLIALASVADYLALRAFLDGAHLWTVAWVLVHFALLGGGWYHVEKLLARRAMASAP